jgi:hypothetical protein
MAANAVRDLVDKNGGLWALAKVWFGSHLGCFYWKRHCKRFINTGFFIQSLFPQWLLFIL